MSEKLTNEEFLELAKNFAPEEDTMIAIGAATRCTCGAEISMIIPLDQGGIIEGTSVGYNIVQCDSCGLYLKGELEVAWYTARL